MCSQLITEVINYFAAERVEWSEQNTLGFATSYIPDNKLHWLALFTLQHISIDKYLSCKEKLLIYFESLNKELDVRKILNQMKRMEQYGSMRVYKHELSKGFLKFSSMSTPEKIFQYSKRQKNSCDT